MKKNVEKAVIDKDKEAKEAYIWKCMCDGFATPEEARQALGISDKNNKKSLTKEEET